MTLPELFVFDMAGTTVHSGDPVPAAFQAAFKNQNIELSATEITAIRGKSKHEAITELLGQHRGPGDHPALVAEIHADFQGTLLQVFSDGGVAPIDGTDKTFEWLSAHRVHIALTTGFDRMLAGLLVRLVNWEGIVDVTVCNEDVRRGRPAPDLIYRAMQLAGCADVGRVAVVGDTVSDLEAGAAAGVRWNFGVLSGAHERRRLEACPHTAIIQSVAEIPRWFTDQ